MKALYEFLLQTVDWEGSILTQLEVLWKLNKLNNSVDEVKVCYDIFYLRELTQKVDVPLDYFKWLRAMHFNWLVTFFLKH
jgi:hypothetical protein